MGKQQLSLPGELKKAAQPGAVIPGGTRELSRDVQGEGVWGQERNSGRSCGVGKDAVLKRRDEEGTGPGGSDALVR